MTKATNPILKGAAVMLERKGRKEKAAIWKEASEKLLDTSSHRVEVNLGHLSRTIAKATAVFVPGKVLGTGLLNRKLVVGAYSFSSSARKKIEEAGGQALEIQEFLKKYPKGSDVLLVE
jgi:large subunit ribosomal protein L18e